MRTLARSLTGCLAVVLASAAGSVASSGPGEDPERILFVGSSFTSDGYEADLDVPSKVAYLTASSDPPRAIEFDRQVAGGATLIGHANNTLTMRKTREGGFDIVVVQGDIAGSPMETTDMFTLGLAALVPEIEASGAEAVLYMTWPWPPGSWTSLDFIAETHRQAEAEHCSAVAPVGIAMADATAERPGLPVIGWDREHQDLRGAYLAAATIYSTLFGESPEGLPYRPDGVSEKDAEFLQRIAWEAVQEWSADKASE